MDTGAIPPTFLGTWCRATQARRTNSFVLWSKCWLSCFLNSIPPPPSPLSTYLASDTAQCLNIITVIIIIIIIIIIILFSSRLFLGLLSHDSAASRKMWAVPRMANNCARPKLSGRLNLPYQAFFILGDSVPITMGSTVTFVTMDSFTFESWYLSTFSPSVVRIFWSTWPSYVNVCHFCVALCTTVISGQLCISSLSPVPNYPPFSTLHLGWLDGLNTCRYILTIPSAKLPVHP